jgi:hypothetical protein
MTESSVTKKTSPLLITGAWLIVLVPIAWGLTYTIENALLLFTASPTG